MHNPIPSSLHLLLLLLTLISPNPSSQTSPQPPPPHPCTSKHTPCPPFPSTPPYPFSTTPGCGHPSFQLNCSTTPHSTLSINNLSFSLLQFHTNSSSLILSPLFPPSSTVSLTTTTNNSCTSLLLRSSIPPYSINFSSSPFRLSPSYCSHLRCSLPPNCSHSPRHPLSLLLNSCASGPNPNKNSSFICQNDILGRFLSDGFEVVFDQFSDSYFSSCRKCRFFSNGVCGFNSSDPRKPFLCLARTRLPETNPHGFAIFSSVFASFCIILVLATVIATVYRQHWTKNSSNLDQAASFLRRHRSASLLPPVFTYEELAASTNRFDSKRKIGDGGFGSVYLGNLRDGRIIAVKYLHHFNRQKSLSTKSFCNEILILSSLNHPNLVNLHGYCSDPRGLLLIYDYVPNGSLFDHLHGNKLKNHNPSSLLTWQVRLEIALQTALALEYLHFSVRPAIVHRDVTSSNIFIERDMRVKLGDFGLSRLLICGGGDGTTSSDSECVWTGPQGTPGYLDPDYHRSFRLTEKSDVYSFGVVLFELVSGLRAVDRARDKRGVGLADLMVGKILMGSLQEVVDPVLVKEGVAMEGVGAVAELAFQCVAADKDDRPNSREVVEELKRIWNRGRG